MITVSHKIKKERLNKKLTQEELADKILVSRQTISNWENERAFPNYDNLVLLAKIFNIPVDHFYTENTVLDDSLESQVQRFSLQRARENNEAGLWRTGLIIFLIISVFIPFSAPLSFCILFTWKEKITYRLFKFSYWFLLTITTVEILVIMFILIRFIF